MFGETVVWWRTTSRVVSLLSRQTVPDSQSGYRIVRVRALADLAKSLYVENEKRHGVSRG